MNYEYFTVIYGSSVSGFMISYQSIFQTDLSCHHRPVPHRADTGFDHQERPISKAEPLSNHRISLFSWLSFDLSHGIFPHPKPILPYHHAV